MKEGQLYLSEQNLDWYCCSLPAPPPAAAAVLNPPVQQPIPDKQCLAKQYCKELEKVKAEANIISAASSKIVRKLHKCEPGINLLLKTGYLAITSS